MNKNDKFNQYNNSEETSENIRTEVMNLHDLLEPISLWLWCGVNMISSQV